MTSRFYSFVCLIGLIALPWTAAYAQKGTAQMSGTVVDLASGAPVANADIIHMSLGRLVISDSLGKYLFPGLPAGIVRLLVRARGFPSATVVVALASDESMIRLIQLDSSAAGRAAAQSLPAVAVKGEKPPTPRFADFERRRLTGRGQYVVREEIEKAAYSNLQDAMRGLRGVNVDCGGNLGCSIRMARAPMRCTPEYIVDERVDNEFGPTTPIRDIDGIEVYTGPSDVPGEFGGRSAGCGVIVIWTRAGPSRRRP